MSHRAVEQIQLLDTSFALVCLNEIFSDEIIGNSATVLSGFHMVSRYNVVEKFCVLQPHVFRHR